MSVDTIFAPASGAGRAAICVIRVSGPECVAGLTRLIGGLPTPRRASLRRIRHPLSGAVLDQGLALWLPGPSTFTGEDQAELHVHGGLAVRAAVLGALGSLEGFRPAEPGEFTRRAFLNGRLDLAEAEGLADLIDAETEAQRRQALRQLEGALGDRAAAWRRTLVDVLAELEARLDFSDEGEVDAAVPLPMAALRAVVAEVECEIGLAARGERLRTGYRVVLAGAPNAGKSSLLNAIARREVALVSPLPGTTRDAIEVRLDLGGLPVTFTDTAGLRESADALEQAGMDRARSRIDEADLVLWLQAPDAATAAPVDGRVIVVHSKADLGGPAAESSMSVSAATGLGLDAMTERVRVCAEAALVGAGDAVVTQERHRLALVELATCLHRAGGACGAGHEELAAEDVRLGLRALGRLVGAVGVEEVLDGVFSRFCIGK